VLDRLRSDLEAGRPFQGETFNYRKDGTRFTMQWRIAAVRDDRGEVTHYVAAQDDISRLRSAEQGVRSLAERLQRALLPDLGDLAPFRVAWRYRPVADHALAGGDWYDAVLLASGSLAVFLGDMVGHGDEATALMGEFRYTCRGLARSHDDPGSLLDELERAVLTDHSVGAALASMVVAVVAPEGEVRYSVAGHPPPVIRRADGTVEPLEGARSPLIGAARRSSARSSATAQLGAGDVLVAFSDGTFERRDQDFDETYAALITRLARADGDPTSLCIAAVAQPETAGPDDAPIDDLVALAVACPTPATTDTTPRV
jgi:serine phosphatase RsbU (regulator of sigma subunit)